MKRWNLIALITLHLCSMLVPLASGLSFRDAPFTACVGLLVSALLMTALLSRSLRIEDECAMMQVALEDPQEAITIPQIQVPSFEEPSTGVKHKVVDTSPTPKVVTWHGQRGQS